jgi:calpain-7
MHKMADPKEKLKLCIAAAQRSLQASKSSSDPQEQAQLKAKAIQLIAEGEQIKNLKASVTPKSEASNAFEVDTLKKSLPAQTHDILDLQGPPQSRKLPVSEQKILWLSSLVNGHKFPPWTRMPEAEDFAVGDIPFWEGYDLSLSPHQRENFADWARSEAALPPPTWFTDREGMAPTMSSSKPIDLVQDTALDCSVVASLCAETSRVEKGYSSILSSTIFPFDPRKDCPELSPSGRYLFRFNFNGCFRAVEIDDRLPLSKSKRMLHIVDRNNPQLLWPALLEKAYLKVRGGYDFPGSNSNTDLWIIAGWIPEIVFLEQYVYHFLKSISHYSQCIDQVQSDFGNESRVLSKAVMSSLQLALGGCRKQPNKS